VQSSPNVLAVKVKQQYPDRREAMTMMTKSTMSKSPILEGKHAVVFGAGGSIGAAIAREFAAEGEQVFLAGRTKSNVEEVAKQITAGTASTTLNDRSPETSSR
jgi:NADP-dependent 3-hydroxy acid dehydrogenase YdfG